MILDLWRWAYPRFLKENKLLGLDEFYALGLTDDLFSTGWAEKTLEGVYAMGSKEYAARIKSYQERGKKPKKPRKNSNQKATSKLQLSYTSGVANTKKEKDTSVIEIGALFRDEFQKRWGHEYPVWGAKENSQIKRALGSIAKDRLCALIAPYIAWNDPFVVRCGHSLGLFLTKIPELEAALRRPLQVEQAAAKGLAFRKQIQETTRFDAESEAYDYVRKLEGTLNPGNSSGGGKEIQESAAAKLLRKHIKLPK